MKTFRCVFHIGNQTKVLDVAAPNPFAAVKQATSVSPILSFCRVEVEDERGHLIPAPGFAGGPTSGRARVYPIKSAA